MVLSSSLPSIGEGALKSREDPRILGTSKVRSFIFTDEPYSYVRQIKESSLLQAASPFYKTFAIECSRAQVSVDMFLFSTAYQDVASLGQSWHPVPAPLLLLVLRWLSS